MLSADAISALTLIFIAGMVGLRTGLQYPKGARGPGALTRAGVAYFVALLVVLLLGWSLAPLLGRWLLPAAPLSPTLPRVVWFLAVYYLYIPLHGALCASGAKVFKAPPPTTTSDD